MTVEEARKHFRLKDNDKILLAGLESLKASTEKQLSVWSITKHMRAELEKELDAINALMKGV